jgi:DNA-binding beta-propeller fold protein YncE
VKAVLLHRTAVRLSLVVLCLLAGHPQPASDAAVRMTMASLIRTSLGREGAAGEVVWVSSELAGRIAQVDLGRGRVMRSYDVRGEPHNLTVAHDGTVLATLQASGLIAVIRDGDVRHVRLGGSPHDVKVSGRRAFVANEGAARLDVVTLRGKVAGAIPLKANPHDLAISPADEVAWVTLDGTDEIALVDLDRKKVLRYLSTGERPHDLLFSPDGRRVWVTDWVEGIHVFSRRGSLLRSIPRGIEPHHLAFTHDGRQVWITDHGANRVLVLSSSRLRVIDSIRIGGAPHHVGVTAAGHAVVANHDQAAVVVFDVETRRKLDTVSVGPGPHGVWPAPL